MILRPQEITLKDGRVCTIRTPRAADGAALLAYMLQCNGETEFVLSYPDEFSLTAEQEGSFVEGQALSPDSLLITCFDGDRAVGSAQIRFDHRDKLRHRASVGIGILRDYWRQGIATRMMELLIAQAQARPGVASITLEYIEGNDRARALYEKLGFRERYRDPDAIRLRGGDRLALIGMVLDLDKA